MNPAAGGALRFGNLDMTRKPLTRDERHAAAILMITRGNGTPIVSREEAKGMTAREIIDAFHARTNVEHIVPHALTANNHPSNIQYLTPDEHAPKTKRDVTEIAKTKRVAKKQAEFRRKLLAKSGSDFDVEVSTTRPKAKIKSRGFQRPPEGHKHKWGSRKMRST